MMYLLAVIFIFQCLLLDSVVVDGAKGKSSVAVPRKTKGNAISRSVLGSVFSRAFRELKVTFCSELEALTLQLTRPTDTQVSLKNLDELVRCLNAEYDNPQFTVSLLAKFSRKLCELNVFTKLKSLICLHKMMQECDSDAQSALTQSVRSLKSEKDEKVGVPFFSSESIEQAAGSASNVAELEAVELAREYAGYVLEYVDFRGEKGGKKGKKIDGDDRAELLLDLMDKSEAVQKACKHTQNGQVVKQCLSCVIDDRPWLVKQMQKLYEVGLDDSELEEELEQALKKWDNKFKLKTKISSKEVSKSKQELEDNDEEESVQKTPEIPSVKSISTNTATTAPIASKIIKESISTPTPVVTSTTSTINTKEVQFKPIPQIPVKVQAPVEPIVTKSPEIKKSSKVTEPKKKMSKQEIMSGNAKKSHSVIDKKKLTASLQNSKSSNKNSKNSDKKNNSDVNSKKNTSKSSKKK